MTALFDAPANYDAWALHHALNVRISFIHRIIIVVSIVFFNRQVEKEHYAKFCLQEQTVKFKQLLKYTNEVNMLHYFQLILILIYLVAFNRDLERDINNRVRGTDFRRMLISAVQVERFIQFKFIIIIRTFKANREELSPQQIQQARQMGIESVIDR